ncbi:TonB-dependent receptor domain-containing protein [Sphingopyxis yananensis]|uniref:TonB-dependent receptor domain-containing protein n=1 Tax=Sphingopyxis yananensis TaxID=2886687 RepID=UPI001D1139E0|nr:TonB-dependent receptor [Sphingopyxis yananensis]MCC2603483.1 TonB-dependent receptor [Sphingopyxis yananensis]
MNIKSTLLLGAAALTGFAPTAFAQDHADHQAENASQGDIIVTGSRIRRTDLAGVGPATVVSAEQLENTGVVNIENVLQRLPAVAGFSGNQTNAYWTGNGYGTAQVNLRGLGIKRTLTLLNGRRLVAGGTGANSSPDLNMIPTIALARTEVLKDGASAIYGADAVSGVVNLVTRNDFEGIAVSARNGITGKGDGHDFTADFLGGIRNDRGGLMFAATYQKTQAIGLSSRAPCALTEAAGSLVCALSGNTVGGRANVDGTIVNFTGGDAYEPYVASKHGFNSYHYLNAVSPIERISTGLFGDYALSDNVTAFAEVLYTHRKSNQLATPSVIRGVSPGLRNGIPISALHPSNPTGQNITLLGRTLMEAGPREFFQTTNTWQATGGLRGKLPNDWAWEVTASFGRNTAKDGSTNIVNLEKMNETLSVNCGTNGAPCGDYLGVGDMSQDVMDYILYTSTDRGGNQLMSFTADVTGELIDLPAGALAFAAGLVYREEKGWRNPDPRTVAGVANNNQQDPVSGKVDTKEAYLEVSVPLLADKPFFDAVTLDAAVRYSDYKLFGSDWNYKLGLDWKVSEALRFRGTYGTGFRVPNVPELFSGMVQGNLTTADPCSKLTGSSAATLVTNCAAAGVPTGFVQTGTNVLTETGGNINLKPESSTTWTLGAVFQPAAIVPGLSLTADWFNIKIEDAIRSVPGSMKLNLCYNSSNMSHPFCADIDRDVATGDVTYIRSQLNNTGAELMRGLDLGLVYSRNIADVAVTLDLNATYLDKYDVVQSVGTPALTYDGYLGGGNGGYSKWRGYGVLTANKGKVTATWSTQWIGKAKDFYAAATAIGARVPNVFYHNAQLAFEVNEKTRFSLGVDNLTDRKAPYVANYTDGNTDTMVYDLMGRRFYVGFRTGF